MNPIQAWTRQTLRPARGHSLQARRYTIGAGAVLAALAISAVVNARLAWKAEQANPPKGRFVEVGGVRLHYVEQGEGEPLVLLHGNGSMIQDFASSGLIELASRSHRVIAFDRPGYGHSERPRTRVWTAARQAELIRKALTKLGIEHAVVLGHSWAASVAVALAAEHPKFVTGLVLASGYYYPSLRADVVSSSVPAIPLVGDIVRYTLAPIVARLAWPAVMRKMFGPNAVPAKFAGFPKALAVRPSQIRASAAEAALMIPGAEAATPSYKKLTMPVVIVAGAEDRMVDSEAQSARLHRELPNSVLHLIPRVGHMVHQTATQNVMTAIDEAAGHRAPDAPAQATRKAAAAA